MIENLGMIINLDESMRGNIGIPNKGGVREGGGKLMHMSFISKMK